MFTSWDMGHGISIPKSPEYTHVNFKSSLTYQIYRLAIHCIANLSIFRYHSLLYYYYICSFYVSVLVFVCLFVCLCVCLFLICWHNFNDCLCVDTAVSLFVCFSFFLCVDALTPNYWVWALTAVSLWWQLLTTSTLRRAMKMGWGNKNK